MYQYILALLVVLITYLAYKLYLKPLRIKAYYSKLLKDKGFKIFEYPYQLLKAPFFEDMFTNVREKGDFNYTGKYIYSDNYDLVLTNVMNEVAVTFFSPELIKETFHKDVVVKVIKKYTVYEMLRYIIRRGIVFVEKDAWQHRRRLISKVFNFQFITSQIPIIIKTADLTFQKYEQEYWKSHPEKREKKQIEISLFQQMTKFTSSIVISSFLGLESINEKLRGQTVKQIILKLLQISVRVSRDPLILIFGQLPFNLKLKSSYRELFQLNQEINNVLLTHIQKYRENEKNNKKKAENQPKSIVELILQEMGKQEKDEKDIKITNQDLVDQIKTFVIAGSDTTSNYLTMSLLMIFQHKPVFDRLKNQIQKYIKNDSDITLQNFKKLKYFDAVLTQCSRLFPTAEGIFERIIDQDIKIGGVTYKKGMSISIYTRPLFSNPKFFPQPLEFKPERWLQQTEQIKQLTQLVSFQFSGGPRGCVGKHLAMTETKVMIIKFLKRFQSLIEPGIKNRVIEVQLTAHLKDSKVILKKFD